jgi:ComF family protein
MSSWSLSNFVAGKFDNRDNPRLSASFGLANLFHWALPQQCAFCAAPCGRLLVCAPCCTALPRIGKACPRCALPAPGAVVCGACLARPPPFTAAYAAFAYAFPLDRLMQAFKYGARLSHADFFAEALSERAAQRSPGVAWPDVLLALPLAPSRQRARGFDQAAEIARRVARITGVPLTTGMRRTRDTPAQAALPWKDRAKNVRGAFVFETAVFETEVYETEVYETEVADTALAGRRVAIVDDVMTTGATLASAANAAMCAGALGVEVWAVARTLPPAQPP